MRWRRSTVGERLSDCSSGTSCGRGPLSGDGATGADLRITPALAGTTAPGSSGTSWTAHPRAGGDHVMRWSLPAVSSGSPPCWRGPSAAQRRGRVHRRITLAFAGSTRSCGVPRRLRTDPRADGDRRGIAGRDEFGGGSPRAGTTLTRVQIIIRRRTTPTEFIRITPHGWGSPVHHVTVGIYARIPPTLVGTTRPSAWSGPTAEHPRAGEDHRSITRCTVRPTGTPARSRGPRDRLLCRPLLCPTTPALAGTTTVNAHCASWPSDRPRAGGDHGGDDVRGVRAVGTPRAGGDHVVGGSFTSIGSGTPPRGRGPRSCRCSRLCENWNTPVRAGTTTSNSGGVIRSTDHPRVGGTTGGRSPSRSSPADRPRAGGNHNCTTSLAPLRHPRAGRDQLTLVVRVPSKNGTPPPGRAPQSLPAPAAQVRRSAPALEGTTVTGTASLHRGSPPRWRGPLGADGSHLQRQRTTPALAEITALNGGGRRVDADLPPRWRGPPVAEVVDRGLLRATPARAGTTATSTGTSTTGADHPRVGGDHGRWIAPGSALGGPLLRWRGPRVRERVDERDHPCPGGDNARM